MAENLSGTPLRVIAVVPGDTVPVPPNAVPTLAFSSLLGVPVVWTTDHWDAGKTTLGKLTAQSRRHMS